MEAETEVEVEVPVARWLVVLCPSPCGKVLARINPELRRRGEIECYCKHCRRRPVVDVAQGRVIAWR